MPCKFRDVIFCATRYINGRVVALVDKIITQICNEPRMVFTALHGMQSRSCDEISVCMSVCLSVRLSVRQTRAL